MLCILYHNKTKNFKVNLVLSLSDSEIIIIYRIKYKLLGMMVILQNQSSSSSFQYYLWYIYTTKPTFNHTGKARVTESEPCFALLFLSSPSSLAWNTCSLLLLPFSWLWKTYISFDAQLKTNCSVKPPYQYQN